MEFVFSARDAGHFLDSMRDVGRYLEQRDSWSTTLRGAFCEGPTSHARAVYGLSLTLTQNRPIQLNLRNSDA